MRRDETVDDYVKVGVWEMREFIGNFVGCDVGV